MNPDSLIPNHSERHEDDGMREEISKKFLRFLAIAKNIDSFEGKTTEELLGTEKGRRDFFSKISSEDYQKLLIGINGIIRNKNKYDWEMDGKKVVLGDPERPSWDFPEFEDKSELLTLSLSEAKMMMERGDELENVATLLGVSLTAIHPFNDGNGRTAKFLLTMTTKGYSEEGKELLGEILVSEEVSGLVNSGIFTASIRQVLAKEIGMVDDEEKILELYNHDEQKMRKVSPGSFSQMLDELLNDSVTEEKKEAFKKAYLFGKTLFPPAIFQHVKENLERYKVGGGVRVDLILQDLSDEDIDKIIGIWKSFKKRFVEIIIDSIANPKKPEYQIGEIKKEGETESVPYYIFDDFKKRSRNSSNNNIVDELFINTL